MHFFYRAHWVATVLLLYYVSSTVCLPTLSTHDFKLSSISTDDHNVGRLVARDNDTPATSSSSTPQPWNPQSKDPVLQKPPTAEEMRIIHERWQAEQQGGKSQGGAAVIHPSVQSDHKPPPQSGTRSRPKPPASGKRPPVAPPQVSAAEQQMQVGGGKKSSAKERKKRGGLTLLQINEDFDRAYPKVSDKP